MKNKLIILELKLCRKKNVEFKVSVIAQGTKDGSQIFAYTNRGWWKITVFPNSEPLKHAPLSNRSMTSFVLFVGISLLSKHCNSVGKLDLSSPVVFTVLPFIKNYTTSVALNLFQSNFSLIFVKKCNISKLFPGFGHRFATQSYVVKRPVV